jgi:hypothetical protein
MEWLPSASVEMRKTATPFDKVAVPISTVPSLKLMEPVAVLGWMRAVKAMVWPMAADVGVALSFKVAVALPTSMTTAELTLDR